MFRDYHQAMRFRGLLSLLLCLAVAACATQPATAPRHRVLLVSIDGLRADAVTAETMPTLDALARHGVRARWMNPSYPSLTFPNHYTLVTGLRPDHHGIVHNTMRDPVLGRFSLHNRVAVEEPRWWGGEPIWVTLQKQGGRAATMFWPGSEAAIAGQHPDDWRRFDATVTPAQRVDQVLAWLDRPLATRPDLITLYFNRVDTAGHADGPRSSGYAKAQRLVDDALARLLAGLDTRGLRDRIDIIVVSDHGMAEVAAGHRLLLSDVLDAAHLPMSAIEVVTQGEVVGFAPAAGQTAAVEDAFIGRHPHYECWRKGGMPARWDYGGNPRIPAIVCQPDVGYVLQTGHDDKWPDKTRGAHGYAPESVAMHAVLIADGPDFVDGAVMAPFDNVDVYPLLARLLGVVPQNNDGDAATWRPVLKSAAPL